MLSRDIEQYLEYAASVRRLSPHTVSNYQRDLNKLLSYCDTKGIKKSDDILACRDAAMFELLYSSGLRLSELVKLNLKDMDLKARMLTVTGKGNKTRELPIGKKAVSAVKDWLKRRDEFVRIENDAVFLSKRGTRISPRSVQARLEYWSKQQAMGHKLHPHMLRHSFASHLLQSSGDLRALQELLGHSNITTTQVYTHLDYQHLAKVYDNAHPRAKLKK
jgi:integrase/recombinase XerC